MAPGAGIPVDVEHVATMLSSRRWRDGTGITVTRDRCSADRDLIAPFAGWVPPEVVVITAFPRWASHEPDHHATANICFAPGLIRPEAR